MIAAHTTQRAYIVEQSPFSESFQIVGGALFRGVFDESMRQETKDSAGVTKDVIDSRIIVATLPAGLVTRTTIITRILTGVNYKVNFTGIDDQGLPVIWLYKG